MNLDDVRQRVENTLQQDHPENAHIEEDCLYEDVLRAVADGHSEAQDMARECVRIADSDRTRWYA